MRRPPTHHPGYENMKTYEHLLPNEYEVMTKCSNCGDWAYIAAPKGMTSSSAAKKETCRKCGCKTLKAQNE